MEIRCARQRWRRAQPARTMDTFDEQLKKAERLISARDENPVVYSIERHAHRGSSAEKHLEGGFDVEVAVNRLHVDPVVYKNSHVIDWVSLFEIDLRNGRFTPGV
jgi:hypothetical protein